MNSFVTYYVEITAAKIVGDPEGLPQAPQIVHKVTHVFPEKEAFENFIKGAGAFIFSSVKQDKHETVQI